MALQRKPCGGRARFALPRTSMQPAQPLLPAGVREQQEERRAVR
ncbi:MAG TPA: hypothetical protein VEX18_22150 [Polyangiaceae bacterium]|nr:hypothetical protein [Polyangiaceae bacterium]